MSKERMMKMKSNFPDSDITNNSELSPVNKNITLFLYEKVKKGDIDPKYVPEKYLRVIKELLLEEKRLKTEKLDNLKKV